MNFEFYIAKRISFGGKKQGLSKAFINIAVLSTAIGIIVMILAVSILDGFKKNVRTKLSVFSGHILITKHDLNFYNQQSPVYKDTNLINEIKKIPEVLNIQCFAIKPGLIKTQNENQGVILKGIDKDFTWQIFKPNIVEGDILKITDDSISKGAIISEKLAKMLDLKLHDKLYMFFLENPPRLRKYDIVGIYSTGLPEFDKIYVLVDIKDVQKLNNWNYNEDSQITGYEIILKDYKNLDFAYNKIYKRFGYRFDKEGNKLLVRNIYEIYPEIFSWLSILDINAIILIIIVFVIASVNMITALLILILDKARIIGILKALGLQNKSISKIFVYNGIFILLKGLVIGNIITLIISFLQIKFHIIPLNPETYFISYVPIELNWLVIIALNLGVIFLTFLILFLPAMIVSKISPVKVIKFN